MPIDNDKVRRHLTVLETNTFEVRLRKLPEDVTDEDLAELKAVISEIHFS